MYKREIAKTIADTHSAENRVAYLLATENYYMVFIEGVLLQGNSATRIKKHDVLERCGYVMRKFYIRCHWLLAITSQPWSKKQAPSKYAHTQSKRRRNPRNMGLSSKSQKKGVVVMESWLEAGKGTMVVSSWQKPIVGATLNQTRKGAMIASLWKESAEKL